MAETTRFVNLLPGGGDDARSKLIAHASDRLLRLARRMLRGYPGVRRWEQTDDVHNKALYRLDRALSDVGVRSSAHFWKLAALQIRRELIDMARHYSGPAGIGSKHHTDGAGKAADDPGGPLLSLADGESGPDNLESWTRFHAAVEVLPEREKEVVSLLWYDGLTQQEAADELGLTLDQVKKRWVAARLMLAQKLLDDPLG
jgi:RNA polymerase sigma-70 factor (ECF subfamily)